MKTIICRHCDMVSHVANTPSGYAAKCIRCDSVIYRRGWCDPAGLFALSLTALILTIPAFYFPLISIHLLGITEGANLLQGAFMMIEDAPVVASVVLFCSVIAPTLLILTIAISSACLTFNYYPTYLPQIFKVTEFLKHWSMLEVYMVSLMVAIFKLMNYADLYFGVGIYFFAALMLVNLAIISNYNNHNYWQRYING